MILLRGRRRIGKSTLAEVFGREADTFLELQGLPPRPGLTSSEQLAAFSEQLARQTGLPVLSLASWPQAFSLLANQIRGASCVVLLDEVSWLAIGDRDFAGHLKVAWDLELKAKKGLVLILCGSVNAWIEENILNNTGFVGRISLAMELAPLPLPACDLFWGARRERVSSLEKLKILSVTGGVPRYLEEIKPAQSAEVNIRRLCFRKEGFLFSEFQQIFSETLAARSPAYERILRALSEGDKSLGEIAAALGRERSGVLSRYLRHLELSGFVRKAAVYAPGRAAPSRLHKYRLVDNYSRFYLRHVEPLKDAIQQGLYATASLDEIIRWDVILGLQFENLVLGNLPALLSSLGVGSSSVRSAAPYFQRRTDRQEACQIDLLIQTKRTLYVCEVKCRSRINREIIEEVSRKVDALRVPRGMSVRPVLVYEGDLDPAVESEGYFDALVRFKDLLAAKP
ncbi:MAG: helix-turn-helix transcriptional regulator [Planctomycetes bacterium]|nr:helix-turn-helix transcriptional regulator [Planctomycetota bacterium]